MRLRRRNLPWLAALGALVGVAVISGAVVGAAAAALLGIYAAAFALSSVELDVQPNQLIDRSRASLAAARMSPEAREATERARRRGGAFNDGIVLADVGMIATQSGRDGIAMRRTRSVTGDDDGVRPYITLRVDPREADRNALVRFEMVDQTGATRYVHEVRTRLRDGEVSVLADHQLPLDVSATQAGDWDLRVYVDGGMVGVHSFNVSPSTRDRLKYLDAREAQADKRLRTPQNEEVPLTLEELLRSQQNNNRSSRQ